MHPHPAPPSIPKPSPTRCLLNCWCFSVFKFSWASCFKTSPSTCCMCLEKRLPMEVCRRDGEQIVWRLKQGSSTCNPPPPYYLLFCTINSFLLARPWEKDVDDEYAWLRLVARCGQMWRHCPITKPLTLLLYLLLSGVIVLYKRLQRTSQSLT